MKLTELLANEELRRHEFPVVGKKIFLAHAGDSPLPRRVVDAVSQCVRESSVNDQEEYCYPNLVNVTRKTAATLLNCQPEEVALVGPTSLGLSLVASGMKFRRGDNILIYFEDYPSNIYPWMALAEQGVEVRLMNTRGLGFIRPRDVEGQVDENTRLVALASCHFISGWRIDLKAIGEILHKRNIIFCVDGIQTLGAFPTTVEFVDTLAADAHKWLLGPCGAGILYVRRVLQNSVTPPIFGWHNVQCPDYVAQESIVFKSDSRKYEAGTQNLLGLAGLRASLELILELGVDNIAAELLRKRAWLVSAIQAKGWTVLQADAPPEACSGIISFNRPEGGEFTLHQKLTDAGIITSLRSDRAGNQYIRVSPHFYNTDAELQRLVEMIPSSSPA